MRRHIRPEDIATAIMMARSHYPTKTVVVVEGDDDCAFFEWHTNTAACRVEVAYGRKKLLRVMEILDERNFRGALGIADADFLMLDGVPVPSRNVVLTDCHDLECMMLTSPALDHVLREMGDAERILAFEQSCGSKVIQHVLLAAAVVGHARWASTRNGWGLRFKKIDFEKFVQPSALALDRTKFVAALRNHQGRRDVQEEDDDGEVVTTEGRAPPGDDELHAAMTALEQLGAAVWHVCCGHDVVALLALGFQRALGTRNVAEVKADRIEIMLRLAYERDLFRATALHAAIRSWEAVNAPFTVL